MIVDRHHLVLYVAVLVVGAGGAYGYHVRSLDVAEATALAHADEEVIAAANKRMDDRERDFKQQITALLAMKSTPATTPTQIVERIPQYFPDLHPTLQQPVDQKTGKPDTAATPNLVFDAPEAKKLNDTLVDCKVCSVEREKLKTDLVDQKSITADRVKEVETWKSAAKGGSIWKRAGKAALVIGCAAAGAYVASPRGSRAAGIGAGVGAGVCTIAWH